ncbi:aminotransferase class I/II-fold pyridoxal phosphate-dependent enzyme [bacterium endosymbiont of Pedicinus badii]|uniref:aminotransferase class I/II-fold pyridoxal phosphate-dependent enzyme n=1 Tax=bacterium endosymbiont of Pedicinus badii TaxID=1719126 RepID=UPI0009BBEF5C|nr:8-amino-7-oxononanoate synthase [bacterium endosymbiont of Pedicinus badii]OQM34334.1 hypothetical protein AOQ89_00345 [bacterium endosymbiont of Pedicinus badii]
MNSLLKKVKESILDRKKKFLYRKKKIINHGNKKWIFYKNKKYLNFSNNNYLGLARNFRVISAYKKAIEKFGIGSTSSSHIVGYSSLQKELEEKISKWMKYSCGLIFNSGFCANQSIIKVLIEKKDFIIVDRFMHASIMEEIIRSSLKFSRFLHNDFRSLEKILRKNYSENKFIFTEGIFSMDGDVSPLKEIYLLKKKYNSFLIVDDAHAFGILGENGRGSTWKICKPDFLVFTFSKALGIQGAIVLFKEKEFLDYFWQFCKNLIYSTSMPPAQIVAIKIAFSEMRKKGMLLRKKLLKNIKRFRKGIKSLNFLTTKSSSPIQTIIIGNNEKTIKAEKFLRFLGFWVTAILPPTVPPKTSRLRIIITSEHSDNDIDSLLFSLKVLKKKYVQ